MVRAVETLGRGLATQFTFIRGNYRRICDYHRSPKIKKHREEEVSLECLTSLQMQWLEWRQLLCNPKGVTSELG